MRSLRAHLSALAILALLASVVPAATVDRHDPGEHLSLAGCEEDAVFLAAHHEADTTLHIEPVAAVSVSSCHGCLLPQKQKDADFAQADAAAATGSGRRGVHALDSPARGAHPSAQGPRAPPAA